MRLLFCFFRKKMRFYVVKHVSALVYYSILLYICNVKQKQTTKTSKTMTRLVNYSGQDYLVTMMAGTRPGTARVICRDYSTGDDFIFTTENMFYYDIFRREDLCDDEVGDDGWFSCSPIDAARYIMNDFCNF